MNYEAFNTELLGKLQDANFAYINKKNKGLNASSEANILKNILFNNATVIITALSDQITLVGEYERLDADLAAADDDYNELNKKYKALLEKSTSKKKTMTAVVEDGE